jgi:secreted trypsin-like serine protease
MRSHPFFCALALAAASLSVAHAAIVDGTVAEKGGAIAKFTVRVFLPYGRCTGTLIAKNIVLTAAHCLIDPATRRPLPDPGSVQIAFDRFEGETLEKNSSAVLSADRFYIDPGYIDENGTQNILYYGLFTRKNHDVALIRLARNAPEDFRPLSAIASRSEISEYGETATVAGYGQEAYAADALSGRLKSATVRITKNGFYYAEVQAERGNGQICEGDSGGPLLIKTSAEGYKLGGVIHAVDHGCLNTGYYVRLIDYSGFLSEGFQALGSSWPLLP